MMITITAATTTNAAAAMNGRSFFLLVLRPVRLRCAAAFPEGRRFAWRLELRSASFAVAARRCLATACCSSTVEPRRDERLLCSARDERADLSERAVCAERVRCDECEVCPERTERATREERSLCAERDACPSCAARCALRAMRSS
ncbi:MAG: hypothetical protein IIY19_06550 [Lachnospiraceae bacterium]|nr:hypothetical protein [Lachnospiraceae bacterium]